MHTLHRIHCIIATRIRSVLVFFISFFLPLAASAASSFGLDEAVPDAIGRKDLTTFIGNMIIWVIGFVGVLFLALIIWGGIIWMTSGGNDQKVGLAKKIIGYATIGLAIIMLGYAITYWVVSALSTASTLSS